MSQNFDSMTDEIKRAVNYYQMKNGESRYVTYKKNFGGYKWVTYKETKERGGYKITKTTHGAKLGQMEAKN